MCVHTEPGCIVCVLVCHVGAVGVWYVRTEPVCVVCVLVGVSVHVVCAVCMGGGRGNTQTDKEFLWMINGLWKEATRPSDAPGIIYYLDILLLYSLLILCLGISKMHFRWIIAPLGKNFSLLQFHIWTASFWIPHPWTFLIISVVTLDLICSCAKWKHTSCVGINERHMGVV